MSPRRLNTGLVVAGLVTSATCIAVLREGGQSPLPVPPGVILLLLIAVFVAVAPWRWAPGAGAFIGLYAALGFAVNGRFSDLTGHDGVGLAIGRGIQVIGLGTAVIAGTRGLFMGYRADGEVSRLDALPAPARRRTLRRITTRHPAQVLGLFVLAPVCAEYLAAYDDSTGKPAELLLGLLILAPLYGGPAVLIREAARRASLGWLGMILLAAAFGVLQAGVVDQSLFSVSYRGIESWDASRRSTLIEPLGISAHLAQLFVAGHVIYSICAPIALVEAFGGRHRHGPWLGPVGLGVTTILYLAASALVLGDHLSTESSHASAAQIGASLLVACGLTAGAFVLGRRLRPTTDRQAPGPRTVFVMSLVGASTVAVAPDTWTGVGIAVGVLVVGGASLARASRAKAWDARHAASAAAGALVSRAMLAYTYDPVVGDVAATPKYLHNTALLAAMVVLSTLAVRRAADPAHDPEATGVARGDE